jgi:ABC-type molybdate transport system substrate-binding protein
MQEEAIFFNKIYGFPVILIPVRAERTARKTEASIEIGAERRSRSPWRAMPRSPQDDSTVVSAAPNSQINSDIEQQLERIAEYQFGDLFLTDSQKHLDKIRNTALSTHEYPVCYLTLTMLVPKGNPHQFQSVRDVLDTNQKLGIVSPSFDGLGESSWKVLGKIIPGGESEIPMELVQTFERQYDLLEALELGNIEAALVWDATSQINFLLVKYSEQYNTMFAKFIRDAERKKDVEMIRHLLQIMHKTVVEEKSFAEEVSLIDNPDERCVVAARLVALSSAFNFGFCERFADFMCSPQGKEVFQRFGFVTK